MKDYRVTAETRRLMEDMISGRHPVKDAEGNEYYVRYNENTEELEEIPAPGLRPLTDGQKAEALGLAAGLRPQGFGALDIATDWLDRKTGGHLASLDADLQRSAESAGLGGWNKAAGFASELGGNVLGAGMAGKAAFEAARPFYNAYQIGRAYDRLQKDPFQGSGRDVITRMKNHNSENVMLQRGEAIMGENGKVISHGSRLQRATGTKRNYGLNKAIYKHDVPREQVTKIPRYIRRSPVEVSERMQDVYDFKGADGNYRIVVSPTKNGKTVSSIYKIER